jgi:phage/plasmid-like protein (TIGR03299 family)
VIKLAHEVESMFSARIVPWHGLGTIVSQALSAEEALIAAGLDWSIIQEPIIVNNNIVPCYKANVRSSDLKVLGLVSDKYTCCQNQEAFSFLNELLGFGVKFETAGSIFGGKKVWVMALLPNKYKFLDDDVAPYVAFMTSHDSSSGIKIACTATRIVCNNTLQVALHDARRIWSTSHVGDINSRMEDARKTLLLAENYMEKLAMESELLAMKKLPDDKVVAIIEELIALPDNAGGITMKNIERLREEMKIRYFDAPDLQHVPKSCYRLLNAVADFCDHSQPLRRTASYQENLFSRTIDGNPLLLKAQEILNAL